MPFDLVGFSEATPGTGLVNIAPPANEQLYSFNGDNLYVKTGAQTLLGVYYGAASTGGEVRVRQPGRPIDLQFLKAALLATGGAVNGYEHLFDRPYKLASGRLQVLSQNATDENTLVGLFLGQGRIPKQAVDSVQPTHRIHGTCDQTLTVNQWTTCTMTWDQDLGEGSYAIVGMRVGTRDAGAATTHALARLLIPGATQWRPGVIAEIMGGDKVEYQTEYTELRCCKLPRMAGIEFEYDQLPNMEMLSPVANDDHVLELELVKL